MDHQGCRALEFVLFDLYDTLVGCDTDPIRAACDAMATRIHVEARALECAERLTLSDRMVGRFGDDLDDELAEVLRAAGAEPDPPVVAEFRECLLQAWRAAGRVYDDVVPSLHALRRQGVRLGLVSNCSRLTRPLLDDWQLRDCFDVVILSCEVGHAKPDPAILERALRAIDRNAGAGLLVDDNEANLQAARDLGLRGRRIDRARIGPPPNGDGVIRDLRELTDPLRGTRTGSGAPRG